MREECRASIEAQQIAGSFDYRIGLHNPYPIGDQHNVLAQYQSIQAEFLAGPWDALLTVEHDNRLPDANALQRLWDTPGDIIYGPYLLRHVLPTLSAWQYIGGRNIGSPLTEYPGELAQARAAGIWRVSGVGMGCTLFHRRVLQACFFRADNGLWFAPDIPIAEDAQRAGFESYANFSVLVDHYHAGEWLTPFKRTAMIEYVALETVRVMTHAGRGLQLVAGRPIELTAAEAAELQSVGYVHLQPIVVEEEVERATLPQIDSAEVAVTLPRRKARRG